jgi:hypothetical protein
LEIVTSGCLHLELLGYGVTAAIHCVKRKNIKNRRQTNYSNSWTSRSRTKIRKTQSWGYDSFGKKYETGIQPPQIAEIKAVVGSKQRQQNRCN